MAVGSALTIVIVTAVGAILALTRIVTVIPMAVIAVTVTVIGAGAPLVVIRPIIAGARVTPEALPGVAARLVRQGTMTALTTPAGKFVFLSYVYVALRGHPCFRANICGWTRLKCCKREKYQCPSPITVSPSFLSFQSILQ